MTRKPPTPTNLWVPPTRPAIPPTPATKSNLTDQRQGGPLQVAAADTAFWFLITEPVRSKSNFRTGAAAAGQEWKQHQQFEAVVAALCHQYRPTGWKLGPPPPAPVRDRPHVVVAAIAATMLDTGNITKSLLDAAEPALFHTDASVRAEHVITRRARTHQYAAVAFAQINTTPHVAELIECSCQLTAALLTVVPPQLLTHDGR